MRLIEFNTVFKKNGNEPYSIWGHFLINSEQIKCFQRNDDLTYKMQFIGDTYQDYVLITYETLADIKKQLQLTILPIDNSRNEIIRLRKDIEETFLGFTGKDGYETVNDFFVRNNLPYRGMFT
jgi:hypothetical protein